MIMSSELKSRKHAGSRHSRFTFWILLCFCWFDSEDGSSMLFRKVCKFLPGYTASYFKLKK
jgi:hypothetical protein